MQKIREKDRGWKKLLYMKVSKKRKEKLETTDSVDWTDIHSV
jgi:hypothetical protein